MTMSINELIERSSHCIVTDGAGNVHSAVKAKIEDLRAIEQEIARLKEIEHLAWHVCEASWDDDAAPTEMFVAREEFEELCEVLPEEHPE